MDCNPPGSSVHGISQAVIPEWVAIPFSRGPSQLRSRTRVFCSYYLSHDSDQFLTFWLWKSQKAVGGGFVFPPPAPSLVPARIQWCVSWRACPLSFWGRGESPSEDAGHICAASSRHDTLAQGNVSDVQTSWPQPSTASGTSCILKTDYVTLHLFIYSQLILTFKN